MKATLTVRNDPVIIIGGGSANGLGIAWNLGSLDIPIYCVTSNPHELTCFSQYCTGYAIVPDVERTPSKLRRVLESLQSTLAMDRGVLFPTTDTALLTVAQIRSQLTNYVTYLPSQDLVETMVFKSKFYRSLERWKVPHPRTRLLTNHDGAGIPPSTGYPLFIRPVQSLLFYQRFGRKGFVARNRQELRTYLRMVQHSRIDVMLQEIIPGPTRNLYHIRGYVDQQSRPIVLLAHQKLRQLTMFSDNTALRSIPLAELSEGVAILRRYFHDIQYTGLFGADFKRDPRDGCLKLLEINARSQGGNYFGVVCDANHILAAYRDSLGEPLPQITQYRTGIYFFHLMKDLHVLLGLAVRGQLSAQELASSPFVKKRHWILFSRKDPMPFLKELWYLVTGLR